MDDLGPFSVRIDHGKTFDRLVAEGGYDHVDATVEHIRPMVESALNRAALVAAKFARRPLPPGGPYRAAGDAAALPPIAVGCIRFSEGIMAVAAPAYADALGARLARPDEMLSFLAGRPDLPSSFWLLAIGGSTDILDGRRSALVLRIIGGKRHLAAHPVDRCALWQTHVLLARH